MLPDRVSNPGPLTYRSGALPIALRGPAFSYGTILNLKFAAGNSSHLREGGGGVVGQLVSLSGP